MDQMFKNKLGWGIQVARGNILNAEVTHRFGMATVGTTFVPIAEPDERVAQSHPQQMLWMWRAVRCCAACALVFSAVQRVVWL